MQRFILSLTILFMSLSSVSQWDQIGASINAENQGDAFGYVLAMDSAGGTLISSSYNNSNNGYQAGQARVFAWNGVEWIQKGSDFLGDEPGNHFPSNLAMNANGNVVALSNSVDDQSSTNGGMVQAFEWNGLDWVQMGSDMFGGFNDSSGSGLSLSANGYRLAIGARLADGDDNNSGNVKILDWTENGWTQVGNTIGGPESYQSFGSSVDLSADGTTVVVGANSTELDGEAVGAIYVYDLVDGAWVQRGQEVYGYGNESYFGGKVSVSADGNTWAASNLTGQFLDNDLGLVRVFEWNGMSWDAKGVDLLGEENDDRFGNDIKLSGDGSALIVGSYLTDIGGDASGSAQVYTWNGSIWESDGLQHGESGGDQSGHSVALNYDGSLMATGEIGYDEPESNMGRVVVRGTCPPNDISITACDEYELPSGLVAETSGMYEEEISVGAECDQFLHYDLTILESTSTFLFGEGCTEYISEETDSIYTESGIYYTYLINAVGCDSVVSLEVMINESFSELDYTACDSLISPSGNYVFYESGIYLDTIPNSMLCDSVITINFTKTQSSNEITEVACGSYMPPSGNGLFFETGVYLDTLENSVGCDSLVTINLTVLNSSYSDTTLSVCDSYAAPNGNVYDMSGTYMDTIPNVVGCDSIISTMLEVAYSTSSTWSVDTCFSFLSPDGVLITESGTYTSVLENFAGCDSTITIDLVVNQVNTEITQDGATLTAQAIDADYQWFDCLSSEVINGANTSTFVATANGSFACQITQNGCTENSECTEVTSIGIEEIGEVKISIFPNPVQSEMTVHYNGSEAFLSILDVAGKELGRLRLQRGANKIDTSTLAPGMYLLRIGGEQVEFLKSN